MKTKELRSGSARASRSSHPDTGRSSDQEGAGRDELPLTQVGRYLLLKKLGEGGMGVVYSAYDPDLDRKVALKLLHADGRSDAELARARLQREAQAMARISHPNVIPIFDVGMWGSQVFMAMEMVDGGTLASWMKEQPRTWREVLEKFLDAGRGLQAAHAAGLVHRDFKPANVLMSREGRVSVTDFGLALQAEGGGRAEDFLPEEAKELVSGDNRMLDMNITRKGLVMGTPNYMSPEQFRGAEVDSRSDQFSFCVALYWCLYGKRAFEPARMREFSSQKSRERDLRESPGTQSVPSRSEPTSPMRVRQTAPLAPASRGKAVVDAAPEVRIIQEPPRDAKVPTWVRNALMRGLELEPGARFPSMAALLDALSQEQRLASRRRWMAGLSAAAVGAVVVGAGVYQSTQVCANAAVAMEGVWNEPARAKLEASFAATKLPFAGEMASRVTQTLGDYAAAWSAQSVEACEATRRHGAQSEELFTRRVACLDRRRQDLSALVGRMSEADGKLVERAAEASHSLPALSECADAAALANEQGLPEDATRRAEVVRLAGQVSDLKALLTTGRLKDVAAQAPALEAAVLATGHLPLMSELRYLLGMLHIQMGKMPEASRLFSQSVYDAEAGRADRLLTTGLVRLLYVEGKQKNFAQAESWASFADAALRRMGGDPDILGDLLNNRSTLQSEQKRFPEALQLLQEARAVRERVLAPDNPKRANSTYNLGRLFVDMGKVEEGVRLLEEALVQTQAVVGPLHPDLERRHSALSVVLRENGRPEPALEHARAALKIAGGLFGEDSPQYAVRLDEVAMCLSGLGRHEEALTTYQRALDMKRKALAPDDSDLSYSLDGVGQELLKLNRPQEAIAPLRQSVAFADLDPDVLAESNFALAKALHQTDASAEARTVAALARKQFAEAELTPRVGEVDAWLDSLPITHQEQVVQVRPKRRVRR